MFVLGLVCVRVRERYSVAEGEVRSSTGELHSQCVSVGHERFVVLNNEDCVVDSKIGYILAVAI